MPMPAPPEPDDTPKSAEPARPVRYRCTHVTDYSYADPVTASHLIAHLAPRAHPRQTGRVVRLTVQPTPAVVVDRIDWFGNPTTYAAIQEPHTRLTVTAEMEVEIAPPPALDVQATPAWEDIRDLALLRPETAEFVMGSARIPAPDAELATWAGHSFPAGRPIAEAVLALMNRIHAGFTFDPTATTISTPVHAVLRARRGVCQDFAHLMIGGLRGLGLPARYISGYLRTLPPPGVTDWRGASVSHAWVQAWCGDTVGWLDLDPTNGVRGGTDHVTLAWGRDYDDVCPLRGVILGGGRQSLDVAVQVELMRS
jgi:transglutaminase-like putative cysteine protease